MSDEAEDLQRKLKDEYLDVVYGAFASADEKYKALVAVDSRNPERKRFSEGHEDES